MSHFVHPKALCESDDVGPRTLVAVTVRDSRSSAANPSSSKAPSQVEG